MADPIVTPETFNAARNVIMQKVAGEVFFNKLAAAGLAPSNEEEAGELLALSARLQQTKMAQQMGQASQTTSYIKHASQALDSVMQQAGVAPSPARQAAADFDKFASDVAAAAMRDPDIYNSVLACKVAQAAAEQG